MQIINCYQSKIPIKCNMNLIVTNARNESRKVFLKATNTNHKPSNICCMINNMEKMISNLSDYLKFIFLTTDLYTREKLTL